MIFRRLLRHVKTGLYYSGQGQWTREHTEALAYQDVCAAMREAARLQTEPLSLVLKFPDERMDISASLESVKLTTASSRAMVGPEDGVGNLVQPGAVPGGMRQKRFK